MNVFSSFVSKKTMKIDFEEENKTLEDVTNNFYKLFHQILLESSLESLAKNILKQLARWLILQFVQVILVFFKNNGNIDKKFPNNLFWVITVDFAKINFFWREMWITSQLNFPKTLNFLEHFLMLVETWIKNVSLLFESVVTFVFLASLCF